MRVRPGTSTRSCHRHNECAHKNIHKCMYSSLTKHPPNNLCATIPLFLSESTFSKALGQPIENAVTS